MCSPLLQPFVLQSPNLHLKSRPTDSPFHWSRPGRGILFALGRMMMRHGRPGPPQSRLSDAALLALPAVAQSRAAELLIAAAAHRISVEHWLAKQQIEQQQTAPPPSPPPPSPPPTVLKAAHGTVAAEAMADMKLTFDPEMLEEWVTAEDAVEEASWHMAAGQRGGPAPAATAVMAVGAASAAAPPPAATAGLSTPAPPPVLAPVLQGVNGPSAQEQGSLEYRTKLKEFEVQLQQLRILRSLSLSLSCRTRRRRLIQPSARPCRGGGSPRRVVHPVYTVPISNIYRTVSSPGHQPLHPRLNVIN